MLLSSTRKHVDHENNSNNQFFTLNIFCLFFYLIPVLAKQAIPDSLQAWVPLGSERYDIFNAVINAE